MAQYQTFPGAAGASRTHEKLKALKLPAMAEKRFLDVGCNEGYFCGFAKFDGALRSIGVDQSKLFIDRARARFPDCEFLLQGWDRLPEGEFDVILLASALHYADDQPALIERLVGKLSDDGVLVVELGIVPSSDSEWREVERGIDRRSFPSMPKLREVLSGYAWKWMGPSVAQQGDPVPRHVIHISRRRAMAYLLMQPPGYGKTSIASMLFDAAGVRTISGDNLISQIAAGNVAASPSMRALLEHVYSPYRIDECIRSIFQQGFGGDLVRSWMDIAEGRDFALDMYVPTEQQTVVEETLAAARYFPVRLEWDRVGPAPAAPAGLDAALAAFEARLAETGLRDSEQKVAADSTGLARGYLDELRIEPGAVFVRGWVVDNDGNLPRSLTVTINGRDYVVHDIEPQPRPDVQRQLRLAHPLVGYCFRVEAPGVSGFGDIGSDFAVHALGGRLRLTGRVRAVLHGESMR